MNATKTKYRVEMRHDSSKAVNVIAANRDEAALRGAIKLGVRHSGRRPTMVQPASPGSALYVIYCWDSSINANNNCHADLYVEEI